MGPGPAAGSAPTGTRRQIHFRRQREQTTNDLARGWTRAGQMPGRNTSLTNPMAGPRPCQCNR